MSIFDKIANYLGTPVKEVGKQFQRDAQASIEFPEQSIIGLTNASQAVQGGIEDASVWAINKEKELGIPEGIANLDALPSVISRMALPQTEEETGAMLATPLVNPVAKFMVEEGSIAGKGMYQGGKALVDKIGGMLPPPPSAMEPALAEGISSHIPSTTLMPAEEKGAGMLLAKDTEAPAPIATIKKGEQVFRGAPTPELGHKDNSAYGSAWVGTAPKIAKTYVDEGGAVHTYTANKDLNLFDAHLDLDTEITPKATQELLREFYTKYPKLDTEHVVKEMSKKNFNEDNVDFSEPFMYPAKELISFLKEKGYDGYLTHYVKGEKGREGLIFDNALLRYDPPIPKPYAAPFYSYLERTVQDKMPARMAGKDLQGLLTNAAVKKEELQYSGMEDLFEKPMVTKQEVLDHLQANKIELKELENGPVDATYAIWDRHSESEVPLKTGFKSKEAARKWADNANIDGSVQPWEGTDNRKFAEYQLPGGKNYKEMLFQLPKTPSRNVLVPSEQLPKPVQKLLNKMLNDQLDYEAEFLPELESYGYTTQVKQEGNPNFHMDLDKGIRKLTSDSTVDFQSSHFDEPNVLAHTRFNEVKDAQGKKVLRIEEIQSDWHQEGRDTGYSPEQRPIEWGTMYQPDAETMPMAFSTKNATEAQGANLAYMRDTAQHKGQWLLQDFEQDDNSIEAPLHIQTPEQAMEWANEKLKKTINGVPDAPFKKNWHEMVMRRMLRYAAENGFDKVAWTTGEQQAKRYPGLIKAFDAIRAELKPNGTYDVYGAAKDQLEHRLMGNFHEAQLHGTVGKDLAQKIVQQKGGEFTGLDLKVGDHGMKVFYDEMLPSYVNKFTKKWGGQVTDEAYPVKGIRALKPYEKEELKDTIKGIMQNDHTFEEAQEKVHELLPGLDLTEELYEDMLAAGRDRSRGNTAASFARELIGMNKKNKLTLHTLTITPEMKRAALTKGFPLFSGAAMLNYLNDGKEEKKKGVQ